MVRLISVKFEMETKNSKENQMSLQKINDLITKCKLLKNSNLQNKKDKKNLETIYENRKNFTEFFQTLKICLKKLIELRQKGYEWNQQMDSIKIGLDYKSEKNNLEEKIKEIDNDSNKWNKKLFQIKKISTQKFELNSLFGLNFIRLNEKNYLHYLSFFMDSEKLDQASELNITENSNSKNKVHELLRLGDFEQSFDKVDKNINKKQIMYFTCKEKTNKYEIILKILQEKKLNCQEREYGKSNIFFKKNQILFCSKYTSLLELQSK